MPILDDIKSVLRISNTAFDTEINDLIDSAKADLGLSGVMSEHILDTDPLTKRAIIVYVKANFGWANPDAEKLQKSYDLLKEHLALSLDYAYYAVTFNINDGVDPITGAEVVFNGEVKNTSSLGLIVFYVKAGNRYEYQISANGYRPVIDKIDITASTTIPISLAVV